MFLEKNMNRYLDCLAQAERDLQRVESDYFNEPKAIEAVDAARNIIQFCKDHINTTRRNSSTQSR